MDRELLLEELRKTPKGEGRAAILYAGENRKLVQSSGANVTLYSGEIKDGQTIKQQLQDINILLIERLNSKTGIRDGLGALGGLSERTSLAEFDALSEQEKKNLVGVKDDIVIQNGEAILTTDINLIRQNNVKREVKEELGNLGISSSVIDFGKMKLVEMDGVKDDNFLINIWDGKGDVWAITPYCHTLKVKDDVIDNLLAATQKIEENSEVKSLRKINLFEALKHYGETGGKVKTNDGRNAENDYRYVHEWLSAWALASEVLKHDDQKMLQLMKDVQSETPWKIDFYKAAQKMGKDIYFVADVLKIKPETMLKMQKMLPKNSLVGKNNPNFF